MTIFSVYIKMPWGYKNIFICKKVIFNEIGDIEIILQNNVKVQVFANKSDAVLWQLDDNINFKSYIKTSGLADDGGNYEYI